MKHTPTPWFVSKKVPSTIFAEDKDTKVIVSVNGKIAIPMHDYDAEFIVQCVNSHDELLEAAKRILKTEDFDIESQHPDCKCSFCCLSKAIAKAELTAGEDKE